MIVSAEGKSNYNGHTVSVIGKGKISARHNSSSKGTGREENHELGSSEWRGTKLGAIWLRYDWQNIGSCALLLLIDFYSIKSHAYKSIVSHSAARTCASIVVLERQQISAT